MARIRLTRSHVRVLVYADILVERLIHHSQVRDADWIRISQGKASDTGGATKKKKRNELNRRKVLYNTMTNLTNNS